MAKFVFGMNQSLDGYVDHTAFAPGPALFRHFIEQVRDQAGSVYGRRLYEVMSYWDDDYPEWNAELREFAAVWRSQPKWVVSRTLTSVGPNTTLVEGDLEAEMRKLKAERVGEIDVGGPNLARSLGDLGLIDATHDAMGNVQHQHPLFVTRDVMGKVDGRAVQWRRQVSGHARRPKFRLHISGPEDRVPPARTWKGFENISSGRLRFQ